MQDNLLEHAEINKALVNYAMIADLRKIYTPPCCNKSRKIMRCWKFIIGNGDRITSDDHQMKMKQQNAYISRQLS